jgi:hypothetical protein
MPVGLEVMFVPAGGAMVTTEGPVPGDGDWATVVVSVVELTS